GRTYKRSPGGVKNASSTRLRRVWNGVRGISRRPAPMRSARSRSSLRAAGVRVQRERCRGARPPLLPSRAVRLDFKDGGANDTVKLYLDNKLVETGTTWEDYYRDDPEQTPRTSRPHGRQAARPRERQHEPR